MAVIGIICLRVMRGWPETFAWQGGRLAVLVLVSVVMYVVMARVLGLEETDLVFGRSRK